MRRRLHLFALVAAMLLPIWATAQEDFTTCRGSANSSHSPFYSYWTDLVYRTESIYPADSLADMGSCTITKLTFYIQPTYSGSTALGRVVVSMAETDAALHVAGDSWFADTLADKVYAGMLNFGGSTLEVVLDEPFHYSGSGNIAINFYFPQSGGAYVSSGYYTRGCQLSSGVNAHTSSSNLDQAATMNYYLAECTFTYEPEGYMCYRPANVAISDLTDNQATLSWTSRNEESEWVVYLDGEEVEVVSGDASYTFDNLESNTTYRASVRAVCADGDTSSYANVSFSTPCSFLTHDDLPLEEDFDSYTSGGAIGDCWNRINYYVSYYSTTVFPNPSTSFNHGDGSGKSLYFYIGSTSNEINYAVMPAVDDLNGLMLHFYTYNYTATSNAYIEVGTMTNPDDASTFESIYSCANSEPLSTWVEHEVVIAAGTTAHYLAFRIVGSAYYATYLDDITLMEAPACAKPSGISVSDITTESAVVHLSDPSETGSYLYTLKKNGTVVETYSEADTVISLDGLDGGTVYTIEAYSICSDESVTRTVKTTFVTECVVLTHDDLPYVENFDSYVTADVHPCWHTLNYLSGNNYPYVTSSTYYGTSGNSLCFYMGTSGSNNYAILPQVDDLNGLMLHFYLYVSYASSFQIQVGTMTDPTDSSTFTTIYTSSTSGSNYSWSEHEVVIPAGTTDQYIAFRCQGSAYYTGNIDEITLMVAPSCTRPASIEVSAITSSTAEVGINDPSETGNYVLTLKQGGSVVETYTMEQTQITLEDLDPATTYTLEVYALCSDGNPTGTTTASFTTECADEAFPWNCTQSDLYTIGNANWNSCWSYTSSVYRGTSGGILFVYCVAANTEFRLPAVDITDYSQTQLRLHAACTTANAQFCVGIFDGQSTTWLDTLDAMLTSSVTDAVEYIIPLGSYTGTGKRLVVGGIDTKTVFFQAFFVEPLDVCPPVSNLTVSNIESTTAHATWVSNGTESAWAVYVDGEYDGTVTDPQYDMAGLSSSSAHTIGVAAICSDTSRIVVCNFRTPCVMLTQDDLPLVENFDSYVSYSENIDPCWSKLNFYTTGSYNYPIANSTANHGSGDGNCLGFYVGPNSQYNYAILPQVDDLNGLLLTFWTYNIYNASLFYIEVGTMTDPSDTTTFTSIYSANSGISTYTWVEHEVLIPAGTTDHYVAFRCKGSSYYNGYIDDVTLEVAPSCMHPASVGISNITATSATVVINDPLEAGNYQITVSQGNTSETYTTTSTEYPLAGLEASTDYTVAVASICDDGEPTSAITTTFTTSCLGIATLPWEEDFNNAASGSLPSCWNATALSQDAMPVVNNGTTVVGMPNGKYLSMSCSGSSFGPKSYAVLPLFEKELDSLQINFHYKFEDSTRGTLTVGYVASSDIENDFVAVEAVTPSADYSEATVSFAGANAPEGARIAFYFYHSQSPYYSVAIDEISVSLNNGEVPVPPCNAPTNLHTTSVTASTATLDWNSDAEEWKVSVDNSAEQTVGSHPYTIENLEANTQYSVRVKAVCSDGRESSWATVSFTTEAESAQGIDDVASAAVGLAPNPASSTVGVSFEGKAVVSVLDMSGREVLRTEANGSATLDVSRLARGTYFVRVGSEHYTAVRKLVVK